MFKFIFKTITVIIFLIFLMIGLSLWKGGMPFRWAGEKIIMAGETMVAIGEVIDELDEGSEKVKETYKQIKEITASEKKGEGENK